MDKYYLLLLIYFYYLILNILSRQIKKKYFYEDKKVFINGMDKELTKDKIVVYSALIGNYDILRPFPKEEGIDYFLFTNIEVNEETNWTILNIPKNLQKMKINSFKKQRFLKLHPHLFFQNYKLSIYLDTSFSIIGNLKEFLSRLLTPSFKIYDIRASNEKQYIIRI